MSIQYFLDKIKVIKLLTYYQNIKFWFRWQHTHGFFSRNSKTDSLGIYKLIYTGGIWNHWLIWEILEFKKFGYFFIYWFSMKYNILTSHIKNQFRWLYMHKFIFSTLYLHYLHVFGVESVGGIDVQVVILILWGLKRCLIF